MGIRWNPNRFWFRIHIVLICLWGIRKCWSLNDEVSALLEFRARITSDPYGALANYNPNDCDPCEWLGVHCVNGKVQMLDLNGLSLEGILAPELGKLIHLKSLVLSKNNFSGIIPKELGGLTKLELLDLSDNNLTGSIPAEFGKMIFLKHLLLRGNDIEDSVSQELGKLRLLSKSLFVDNHTSHLTAEIGCMNRKFGHCVWQSNFKQWNKAGSLVIPIKGAIMKYINALALPLIKLRKAHGSCNNLPSSDESEIAENVQVNFEHRKLLDQSSNLAAAPISGGPTKQIIYLPTTLSSGAFPAVPDSKKNQNQSPASLPSPAPLPSLASSSDDTSHKGQSSHANDASGNFWKYIIIISGVAVLVIFAVAICCTWKKQAAKAVSPWKTGISGQLQKAFVTGVPKLNRPELETACEDFSNIIDNIEECTIYKGTLSNGVEIAVVSTMVTSSTDWSKNSEMAYRKKIATLSRINHKNFTNLIGFCEEQEPFTRMMVFEYAPNGTLHEHLHVKEVEHLDWNTRMRIIMGMAYCLQYMHHDLNPPVSHSNLKSANIFLTDDFAAKISEIIFGGSIEDKSKSNSSVLPPPADPETNVYNFGMLLLEIISGKLPNSEEQDHIVNCAAEYLNDRRSIGSLIDPTLQSFKEQELVVICEVIQECIHSNPRLRPIMKDITSKLRQVINISPDQAVPRLSPLWWAELEILSLEAN